MTRKGHGQKLGRKQEIAIAALLSEPTLKQAAAKTGIADATLFRWLQDQEFSEQYRETKKLAVSQAVSRLQQSCGEAVEVLREVMADATAPPSSRVAAAKTVIEMGFKAVEIEELEARIIRLEQLQESNELKEAR